MFHKRGDLTLAWLRRVYETYPRRFSLAELLVIFGILVIYQWIVSFWYWGIYRLDLAFPESLSDLFYRVWLEKDVIRAILVSFLVCVIVLSNHIRRVSWEELGIRLDNIRKSGRECLAVLCILLIIAAAIVLAFPHKFSFDGYFDNIYNNHSNFFVERSLGVLSGTVQQFLLQSIFLVRALQIFRRKSAAVLTTSILFSLLHAPNTKLMILTLLFGVLCSLLFIRNRNIITLGAMHGVVQQIVRVLFASFLVSGISYYDRGHYDYNLRVGPRKGDPRFLAHLEYNGSPLKVNPSGVISIPVSVINKGTSGWNSVDKNYREFISYLLLDSKKDVVSQENIITHFNKPIESGESATVNLMVSAPQDVGDYYVEVDILLQQVSGSKTITWFKLIGSKTVLIPLSTR